MSGPHTLQPAGRDDPELEKRLSDELDAINNAAIGVDDETPLSIRVTDADGELVGGITGYTWAGCGGISSLWLAPHLRGQGLGARLMAAAEDEIRRRGCDRVVVSTMSFQAPDFYPKLGYQQVGLLPRMPGESAKHFFLKSLT
ncbi:GNAT family N-acetyltransferase [Actinoplanes sp. NBRC 101535]|uniref:GNAT family N-acetyltransferase n=1 Tax=Actinoplanes sp. NBRC 101535 TaxID=3032196 RepID=UPI0024A4F8F3|nr:GNAT family N-acetyltransferase [Actinoplanes sp. NBRC 101535]GLY07061.1 N-acetyltransferase [Actinoplanes sp. NBRC 101535]